MILRTANLSSVCNKCACKVTWSWRTISRQSEKLQAYNKKQLTVGTNVSRAKKTKVSHKKIGTERWIKENALQKQILLEVKHLLNKWSFARIPSALFSDLWIKPERSLFRSISAAAIMMSCLELYWQSDIQWRNQLGKSPDCGLLADDSYNKGIRHSVFPLPPFTPKKDAWSQVRFKKVSRPDFAYSHTL